MRTLSISRRQDHHRNCGETPQPSVVLAMSPEHKYYVHQGFQSQCLDLPLTLVSYAGHKLNLKAHKAPGSDGEITTMTLKGFVFI